MRGSRTFFVLVCVLLGACSADGCGGCRGCGPTDCNFDFDGPPETECEQQRGVCVLASNGCPSGTDGSRSIAAFRADPSCGSEVTATKMCCLPIVPPSSATGRPDASPPSLSDHGYCNLDVCAAGCACVQVHLEGGGCDSQCVCPGDEAPDGDAGADDAGDAGTDDAGADDAGADDAGADSEASDAAAPAPFCGVVVCEFPCICSDSTIGACYCPDDRCEAPDAAAGDDGG